MFMTGYYDNHLRRLAPVSSSGVITTITVDNFCSGGGCGINLVLRETPGSDVTLIWSSTDRSRSSFARVTSSQLVNQGVAGTANAFSRTNYSLVNFGSY